MDRPDKTPDKTKAARAQARKATGLPKEPPEDAADRKKGAPFAEEPDSDVRELLALARRLNRRKRK
jgi:DNA invertase Pin-like site-specific DNA recombinase